MKEKIPLVVKTKIRKLEALIKKLEKAIDELRQEVEYLERVIHPNEDWD